jgi:hypothetical protein
MTTTLHGLRGSLGLRGGRPSHGYVMFWRFLVHSWIDGHKQGPGYLQKMFHAGMRWRSCRGNY